MKYKIENIKELNFLKRRKYFQGIIDIIKENKLELILIKTKKFPYNFAQLNNNNIEFYHRKIDDIKRNYQLEIYIAHELGHKHIRNKMGCKYYIFNNARYYESNKKDKKIVLYEEFLAWEEARRILRNINFIKWKEFEKNRIICLRSYIRDYKFKGIKLGKKENLKELFKDVGDLIC